MSDARPDRDLVHELINLLGVVIVGAQVARFAESPTAVNSALDEVEEAARHAVSLLRGEASSAA